MDRHGYGPSWSPGGGPPPSAARLAGAATWRTPLALVMTVLGCLLVPAALAAVWFHTHIMDVDGYVAAVTPVADEPAVQEAVADALAEQVSAALDPGSLFEGTLLEGIGDLTGSLGGGGLEQLTRELTRQAVSGGAFRGFWAAANRRIHPVLLAAVEGDADLGDAAAGLVALDLGEVTRTVTDLLSASGVRLPEVLPSGLTAGDVAMLHSGALARAGSVIRALDLLFWLLPPLALALLGGGVALATRRWLVVAVLGAGVELGMAALLGGTALARAYYLEETDLAGVPHAASAAVWDVITKDLRLWGWALLGFGVAAAAAGALGLLLAGRGRPRPASGGVAPPGPIWPPPNR